MTITTPRTNSLPSAATASRDPTILARRRAAIRTWLIVVAMMIIAMIVVGGATRLTESGLSITEWKPIHGVLPPLNAAEWQEEFLKYQQIPQYKEMNAGMTLDGFQFIFWWEWSHRLLGRVIGLVFALPLLFFWVRGWIPKGLGLPLVGLLALGGLQGFVGWWMVASGLVDRVEVSQYRLAIHLTLACFILVATLWVATGLRPVGHVRAASAPVGLRRLARVVVAGVLLQIFLGGLVAGLRAGWTFNTWPLIDGGLVPGNLFVQAPWWANLFENPLTVQFDHRMVAYALVIVIAVQAYLSRGTGAARGATALLVLALAQATLGVLALIHMVPLDLGLAHQLGAAILLSAATIHARSLTPPIGAASSLLPASGETVAR